MKNSYITVTDQFCGAGGSSQGVRMVAREKNLGNGLEVKLAMNHWKLAIETHNTNFPDTDHVCTDISACDPRRYPSTSILITSPECTVHSPAGGGQAKKRMHGNQLHVSGRLLSEVEEERSRATMWDVCRFTEYHKYELIIVENVIEARNWILFDSWLSSMVTLGYEYEIKYINSMHAHPTPQSRDRMYCVFWKKGNRKPNLEFTPLAFCDKCFKNVHGYQWWKPKPKKSKRLENHGKYKTQYLFKCPDCNEVVDPYFHAAFNCIDWSKPGTRIGDRKKRLSPKTEKRCEYGIGKFWDEPSIINVKFSSGIDFRVKSCSGDPLTTQPGDAAVGVLRPQIISSRYITGIGNRVKRSEGPLPVQVTDGRESVLFPPAAIVHLNYDGVDKRVKSSDDALPSQTTQEERSLLFPPLIASRQGETNDRIRTTVDSLPTQLTDGHDSILTPPLVIDGGWNDSKRIDVADRDALSVQDTGQTKGILMPLVVENHGTSKSRPATDRLPGLQTQPKHGIITDQSFNSFIAHYYGGSNVASHIIEATRTISTKDRSALITPPEAFKKPMLEDCFYRMLLPHEIQLGMAFDKDYIVLGDSKQKVRQLGNAVTPPVMKFLIERCIETLK